MNIKFTRSDITYKGISSICDEIILDRDPNRDFYHLITFPNFYDEFSLRKFLSSEIDSFIEMCFLKEQFHALVIGIGNDSLTADSIGPKVIKNIIVNAHLKSLGLHIKGNTISAVEPGVLGETGIETDRIVMSVTKEVKPNLVILIDSLVTDSKEELTHSIVLTDEGLTPGSGLKGMNCEINSKTLGCPVLTIGIPTALEVSFSKEKGDITYLMSPSNIDNFVHDIALTIADAINDSLLKDERC